MFQSPKTKTRGFTHTTETPGIGPNPAVTVSCTTFDRQRYRGYSIQWHLWRQILPQVVIAPAGTVRTFRLLSNPSIASRDASPADFFLGPLILKEPNIGKHFAFSWKGSAAIFPVHAPGIVEANASKWCQGLCKGSRSVKGSNHGVGACRLQCLHGDTARPRKHSLQGLQARKWSVYAGARGDKGSSMAPVFPMALMASMVPRARGVMLLAWGARVCPCGKYYLCVKCTI